MDDNQIEAALDEFRQELLQFILEHPWTVFPLVYSFGIHVCRALSQVDKECQENTP